LDFGVFAFKVFLETEVEEALVFFFDFGVTVVEGFWLKASWWWFSETLG
jgi:hypothetical protein